MTDDYDLLIGSDPFGLLNAVEMMRYCHQHGQERSRQLNGAEHCKVDQFVYLWTPASGWT